MVFTWFRTSTKSHTLGFLLRKTYTALPFQLRFSRFPVFDGFVVNFTEIRKSSQRCTPTAPKVSFWAVYRVQLACSPVANSGSVVSQASRDTPYEHGRTLKSSFRKTRQFYFLAPECPTFFNVTVSSEIGSKSMPKVGGVLSIILSKVQKRVFSASPRGFRGRGINLTCNKVSTFAALCLKSADFTDPENTRHFCWIPTLRIRAQAWELLIQSQNWVQESGPKPCFKIVTTYRENRLLAKSAQKHESLRSCLRGVSNQWSEI